VYLVGFTALLLGSRVKGIAAQPPGEEHVSAISRIHRDLQTA
jgi:hypothetical protein